MSITGMINTALSGIFTAQSAMRTVSSNISNVNTEGYQRQVVRQENLVVGGNSVGVRITEVERIVDRFLSAAGLTASSATAEGAVQREFHDRFQSIIGKPDSGTTLSARLDKVFNSFAGLTLSPADGIVRQATLESITDLSIEVSRLAQNIQDLRSEASQKIREEVLNVNEALERIHTLNPLIIRQIAQGGEAAGLETQRDMAVADLAKSIDVKTITHDDGLMTVLTSSGVSLVDLARRELEYVAPGVVTAATNFSAIRLHRLDSLTGLRTGSVQDLDENIKSGSLRGLLDLREGDLNNLSLSLGEFASNFATEINAVHNSFSAFPPPNSMVGELTNVDAAHPTGFTGKVTFAVVNASGVVVDETLVDFDGAPPASYTALLAQVNAGLAGNATLALTNGVMSLTATNAANGVLIKDDAAAPSVRGGKGFSHFFGMNNLIEAKVSGDYRTGLTGAEDHNLAGSATFEVKDSNGALLHSYTMPTAGTTFANQIANLSAAGALGDYYTIALDANGQLNFTEKPGYNNLKLSVPSDSTSISGTSLTFSRLFGIGDRYNIEPSRDMQVRNSIAIDPQKMSLSSFDLAAGIGNVALSKGDQTGSLAFQGLQGNVVNFDKAGELAQLSVSFTQYSAAFLANSGAMGARATSKEQDNLALKIEIDQRNSDVSGVNLDEELSQMIVLQTSFNAAARLISSAEEMMQTLIDTV